MKQLAKELDAFGKPCDATSGSAFGAFHTEVESRLGPVEGIVNCAGLWAPAPYETIDERAFTETIDANLRTAFVACQTVLPGMVARGHGSVVNFASTAGEYGSIRPAAHYAAAKGAINTGLVLSLKNEIARIAPTGRVNVVAPGWTATPRTAATLDDETVERVTRTFALRKVATPEEVARTIVWVSSAAAGHTTGALLTVDGGMEGRVLW